ncbi:MULTISPECIES: class C sortase [Agathobacter]|uniref:Class C sortase n=1 Tax=Agathobacter ruminis TaxID=1712665 RepID=A0A2G3E648_9FIRM|nr:MULTISPECIES: class C sortase [Agathobacter]MBQ1680942.1 class C sortase [Agathobacter sp.]MDC7301482.1 class C sortase [Agathobacter ruminis]PHU38758.1 class C sortase [Agathobacter ruminis]
MKKNWSIIVLIVLGVLGLSLLLYPTFSDWWNSFHQSKAIAAYTDAVDELSNEEATRMYEEAKAYNEALLSKTDRWEMTDEEYQKYESILDVTGTGIMGYVEIPSVDISLPIYHGLSEEVLQIGVGHIEGSSFPIGGRSTHCVLSSHRGLPSAKLFTDIDQMVEGDIFFLHTLGNTLTYQVDQIRIVLPEELNELKIESDKDYCTLVTCTPYGINSHRLLVRGHRIPTSKANAVIVSEANQINPLLVSVFVGVILLIIYSVIAVIVKRKIINRFR